MPHFKVAMTLRGSTIRLPSILQRDAVYFERPPGHSNQAVKPRRTGRELTRSDGT